MARGPRLGRHREATGVRRQFSTHGEEIAVAIGVDASELAEQQAHEGRVHDDQHPVVGELADELVERRGDRAGDASRPRSPPGSGWCRRSRNAAHSAGNRSVISSGVRPSAIAEVDLDEAVVEPQVEAGRLDRRRGDRRARLSGDATIASRCASTAQAPSAAACPDRGA